MTNYTSTIAPQSTADIVFQRLYDEIANLDLLPGAKISEAEVSRRFEVTRQPVRDAFKRLGNLDLIEIRPQRASVVRRFSMVEIANVRFVRLALELELIEVACKNWTDKSALALRGNLDAQQAAFNAGDTDSFHTLDYVFHELICKLSGQQMAFETIAQCKRKVERLCVLSLTHDHGSSAVLEDHYAITDALTKGSVPEARRIVRRHLGRLDATIAEVYDTHASYFQ